MNEGCVENSKLFDTLNRRLEAYRNSRRELLESIETKLNKIIAPEPEKVSACGPSREPQALIEDLSVRADEIDRDNERLANINAILNKLV